MSDTDPRLEAAKEIYEHIVGLPEEEFKRIKHNPEALLNAIDDYTQTHGKVMNIGKVKGDIIVKKLREIRPKLMIELGCFFGYSAIMFSKEGIADPHFKYYSFEVNTEYISLARKFIEIAGLSDRVEIIHGKAGEQLVGFKEKLLQQLHSSYISADFIFIDHWKNLYVPDLRVLETLNLVAPGTVIVADNILVPGAPDYVAYVRATPEEKREHNYTVENISGKQYVGRWNIIYKTETLGVESNGRRDAIEITECVEYLNS